MLLFDFHVPQQFTGEITLYDWSQKLHGTALMTAQASVYNERVDAWEPLIEPLVINENIYRPWEVTATLFQVSRENKITLKTSPYRSTAVYVHNG